MNRIRFTHPSSTDIQRARTAAARDDRDKYVCADPLHGIVIVDNRRYQRDQALILQAIVHPSGDVSKDFRI
jgi:hypothetical protein